MISKEYKFHTPLIHTHTNTNSPPSPPPSHHPTILQSPTVNANLSFKKKYSFLKGQMSQRKTIYPNSSCTCQLNIIRIPYRNKCFISSLTKKKKIIKKFPSLPKPLALLDAFVTQKFPSTMAIREGRFFPFFLFLPPSPGIAESHNWQNTPHRGTSQVSVPGGSPRALQPTRAALPSRTTLARQPRPPPLTLSPTGPSGGAARGARPGNPLGEAGRWGGGAAAGLPSPELTHLVRRPARRGARSGAGAGREAGSGSGSAGASFPLAGEGRGEPRLSRHRGYSILHHDRRPLPHARLQPTAAP